jgi:hypothetical protein
MTKGVLLQDVIASGDQARIRDKLIGLLSDMDDGVSSMPMQITVYSAQLCAIELERQAAEKIAVSSKRLETLTAVLICLTVLLTILTIPLTWEVLRHIFK